MAIDTTKTVTGLTYNGVELEIAGGAEPVISPLTVTQNGTHTAPEGVDGYNPVTVEVEATPETFTVVSDLTGTAAEVSDMLPDIIDDDVISFDIAYDTLPPIPDPGATMVILAMKRLVKWAVWQGGFLGFRYNEHSNNWIGASFTSTTQVILESGVSYFVRRKDEIL